MHTNTGRQTRQKLREPLQRAQRLYLFYFFFFSPCSYPDLDKWDAMIGRVIKSKHNIWRSTLTAMICEDVHNSGSRKQLYDLLRSDCRLFLWLSFAVILRSCLFFQKTAPLRLFPRSLTFEANVCVYTFKIRGTKQ